MNRKHFFNVILLLAITLVGSSFCLNEESLKQFARYDDIIDFISKGYQTHWSGGAPDDNGLSYIYSYSSKHSGYVKYDINGDGANELLIGDQYDNGDYLIYDIFTYSKKTRRIIHLFCGGERDWCTINSDRIIIETGSNSAFDSSTDYYTIKDLKLNKLDSKNNVKDDLLPLTFEKFSK